METWPSILVFYTGSKVVRLGDIGTTSEDEHELSGIKVQLRLRLFGPHGQVPSYAGLQVSFRNDPEYFIRQYHVVYLMLQPYSWKVRSYRHASNEDKGELLNSTPKHAAVREALDKDMVVRVDFSCYSMDFNTVDDEYFGTSNDYLRGRYNRLIELPHVNHFTLYTLENADLKARLRSAVAARGGNNRSELAMLTTISPSPTKPVTQQRSSQTINGTNMSQTSPLSGIATASNILTLPQAASAVQILANPTLCTVMYDFVGTGKDQLTLKMGNLVKVFKEDSKGWSFAENVDGCFRGWIPSAYLTSSAGVPKEPPPPSVAPPMVPGRCNTAKPGIKEERPTPLITSNSTRPAQRRTVHFEEDHGITTSTAASGDPKSNVNMRSNPLASDPTPVNTASPRPSRPPLASKDVPNSNVLPLEAIARTKGFSTWEARVAATVAIARALDPKVASVEQTNHTKNGIITTAAPDQARNLHLPSKV